MPIVTAASLWSETRAVVARHRNAVLTLAAAFVFLPGAATRLLLPETVVPVAGAARTMSASPAFFVLLLAAIAFQIAGVFAIAAITADRSEGGGRTLGETLTAAIPAFGRFMGALGLFTIGYLIASVVLALVLGIIVMTGGLSPDAVASAGRGQPPPALAAAIVAIALPILIWLWARLLPLVGIYLRESAGIVGGIRRAWALTRGQTLPLVALLLGVILATLAIGAIQDALPATPGLVAAIIDLIAAAAGAWIFAYAAAATGVVYRELSR